MNAAPAKPDGLTAFTSLFIRRPVLTIVLNLLDNARKHGAAGTPVTLRLTGPQAGAGPVIALENVVATPLGERLHQLTTAWYQADPLAPGTGLGLWIAGRLAHGLGLRLALQEHQQRLVVTLSFPATQ